jgi:hypothetical protein
LGWLGTSTSCSPNGLSRRVLGHFYLHERQEKGHVVTVPGQHAMKMYGQWVLNISTGQGSSVTEGEGTVAHLDVGVKQKTLAYSWRPPRSQSL